MDEPRVDVNSRAFDAEHPSAAYSSSHSLATPFLTACFSHPQTPANSGLFACGVMSGTFGSTQYIGLCPWTMTHGVFALSSFAARRSVTSQSYIRDMYASSKYSGQKKASALNATTCRGPTSNE